jgi:NADH:ubiquinone oxidoreductase subunit 2 (subunit N)
MAGFASSLFYMILYAFTNLAFLTFCVLIVCESSLFLSTGFKHTHSVFSLFKSSVVQSHRKPKAPSNFSSSPLLKFINQTSIEISREVIYLTDLYKSTSFNKIYCIYFFILLLSLAGIPPMAGFVGKFYLLSTSIFFDKFLVVFFLLLSSLVSAFYYLRVVTIISSEQKFFVSLSKQKRQLSDSILSFVITSPISYLINIVLIFVIYITVLELCSEKNLSFYSQIGHLFFS